MDPVNPDRVAGPTPDNDATVAPTGSRPVAASTPARRAGLPATIGRFRILGRLGEGGMGIVFEAEQEHPRRHVALKVIRGGTFVDEQQVRLFQREVDTLARLKHPNIAAIYEAGHTDAGEHFFAMELVRGASLGAWLRARPTPVDAAELRLRLRLFLAICGAVNYAHQRGVIHRVLKPSNIVVAEVEEASSAITTATTASESRGGSRGLPEVKILDFGLARITESDVDAATAVSEVGEIKGTLPYMSPEQARGDSDQVDLRTDVYALGVLLYEMLTGARPYDTQTASIPEAVRIICEQPPSSLRHAWKGTRPVDGDLETIVGKALEKEADRRYASAAALAEDVERHLDSRPILARSPSTLDQLRKFTRRNRTLVAGVTATMIALLAGIVATTTFGLREATQRRAAEQARLDTEAVVEFQRNMLGGIDALTMARRLEADLAARVATSLREDGRSEAAVAAGVASLRAHLAEINTTDAALRVLDENVLAAAIDAAAVQFPDRPRIRAQLLSSIGDTYFKLGLFDKAEPTLVTARALYDSLDGAGHTSGLRVAQQLGALFVSQGRVPEAEPLYVAALAGHRRTFGDGSVDVVRAMNDLGLMYTEDGRSTSAESLLTLTLAAQRRLAPVDDRFTFTVMHNLAWARNQAGDYAGAESLAVGAMEGRRRLFGPEHPETMQSLNNLAVIYARSGRPEKAEPLYLLDYEVSRRALGEEHPEVLVSMTNLGRVYNRLGKFAEAEAILRRSLASTRRVMPPGYVGIGITQLALGEALVGLDRPREAEPELLGAHAILRALSGDDGDPGVQRAVKALVGVYETTGRPGDAARWRDKLRS